MQTLTILQGTSGSGKSTVARKLQQADPESVICSTDDFHIENGVYSFKADKLGDFHKLNLEKAKKMLDEGKSVIVDNTNIRAWECKGYVEHAVALNIPVIFIRVDGNFQNTHGVPQDKVDQMRRNMDSLNMDFVLKSKPPWERK